MEESLEELLLKEDDPVLKSIGIALDRANKLQEKLNKEKENSNE